jgi:hypothetical protein
MKTEKQHIKMEQLATKLVKANKNIILVYAFNGTGKTRLSVAYKNVTKNQNKGKHSGVYYNAYSEDLFVWDNDEENDGANIRLLIHNSSLNQYHALLDEDELVPEDNKRIFKEIFEKIQSKYQFVLHDNKS